MYECTSNRCGFFCRGGFHERYFFKHLLIVTTSLARRIVDEGVGKAASFAETGRPETLARRRIDILFSCGYARTEIVLCDWELGKVSHVEKRRAETDGQA